MFYLTCACSKKNAMPACGLQDCISAFFFTRLDIMAGNFIYGIRLAKVLQQDCGFNLSFRRKLKVL